MCSPRLALLQAFFLMVLEGARPQPSSSSPGAVPTPSDLGPSTLGGSLQPSLESTGTPRALPGTSAVVPTAGTSSTHGNKTVDLFPVLPICVCDLIPGACDINCCCDRDCYLPHPSTVFSFCLPGSVRSSSWVCVDHSLIFRSNSPFPTRVFMDSNGIRKFCVHVNNSKSSYFRNLQNITTTNFQSLAAEFGGKSFTSAFQTQAPPSFYRAGDPIVTYFPKWSIVSLLRQPADVGAGGLCVESNPASFLESKSTTCTRFFKNLARSCILDPALNAASYYNFSVLKVPRGMTDLQNMRVPITLASQADSPLLTGNTCQNVVSEVTYEIETNGTFGIQRVSINFELTNLTVEPDVSLQQHFITRFKPFEQNTVTWLPGSRSGNPGYIVGKPLLSLTGHMTLLQSQSDGTCSSKRHVIEFGMNTISGCKLRLKKTNCSHLHQDIYQMLHGRPRPEHVAIFGNADPSQKGQWTRILSRNCNALELPKNMGAVLKGLQTNRGAIVKVMWGQDFVTDQGCFESLVGEAEAPGHLGKGASADDATLETAAAVKAKNCTSCCFLPVSLEIQVLWAYIGLQSNPQAHVPGVRFFYHCQAVQDSRLPTEVSLTTLVTFVDITRKPEPPRGQPQKDWKLPFDFFFPFRVAFSRGVDAHKGSVLPVVILCILLLGVLNLDTK